RCSYQVLSPSRSLAVSRSRIGGSTVLSAANIHVIARARALASSGSRPAGARRYGTRSPLSRTGRDRLPHRSESGRKDEEPDARVPSSHGTKRGEPHRVGPLPQAPSERAYRAPVP